MKNKKKINKLNKQPKKFIFIHNCNDVPRFVAYFDDFNETDPSVYELIKLTCMITLSAISFIVIGL